MKTHVHVHRSNTGNTPSSLSVAASFDDPLQFSRHSSFSRTLVDDTDCEDMEAASTASTGGVAGAPAGAAAGVVAGPVAAGRSSTPVGAGGGVPAGK